MSQPLRCAPPALPPGHGGDARRRGARSLRLLGSARRPAQACCLLLLMAGSACERVPAPRDRVASGRPERILPTNASALDYVFDLTGPERIVAIPSTAQEFCTVPLDFDTWPAERSFHEFSAEVLLAFDPDLVVVSPWQDQSTIERLLESQIPILELPAITRLEDIRATLREVGEATGEPQRARETISAFDARVTRLREVALRRGELRGLTYTNYGSGGWAAGSGTTAHLVMELAGVLNVAAEAGRQGHDDISIEELLTLDPDLLIVSKPSDAYGVTRAYLESEPALRGLRAIAQGRIVEIPANLFSTTSQRLLDAAEVLSEELEALLGAGEFGAR